MPETFADKLQRYQIMDPLGRGSSGHTFRAIDRTTSREVAVKVLSLRDTGGDWKRFDLFEREVAVLKTLDHPGIPKYIDSYASEATGDYFLVMELVRGQSLHRRIAEQQRLDAATLRDLLGQGLAILEYLHGLSPPVIHRDVKPANLVLDERGRLHLVDFGGVRKAAQIEGGTTMIGTFGYMAPEQLHGESGPATDLYSLGATIVALRAGVEADRLPHDGLRIDLPALALPPALAPALARMLEPDPKLRVRTAAEALALLHAPPRAQPSAHVPAAPPPARALVPLPVMVAQELANVPKPFSVLVWILSALANGALTVFELVMLPLILQIVQRLDRDQSPQRVAKVDANMQQFQRSVSEARRTAAQIAGQTHPFRNERLEPDDERKDDRRR